MKLFCPGPVMISNEVRDAITSTVIGHRSTEFENLYKRIKKNTLKLTHANSSYDAIIMSSSGSSANEAVISSLFTREDKILILSNGSFGERIEEMMKLYKLNYQIVKNEWGTDFDLDSINQMLTNTKFDYLFVSHDETSSGLLNPLTEIGKLCKTHNIEMFVDCVSSLASDYVDVNKQNISILTSVSGKAIGAIPGASIVVMKKELFEKTKNNSPKSFYLDLSKYYEFSVNKNQTPNTPNITSFVALDIALIECIEKDKHINYLNCSNYLRDSFEKMNLGFVIDRSKMSNTVTTIILPKTIPAKEVYDKLYKNGYTTYLTRGIYSDLNCIQVCVMGEITLNDCKDFIKTLKLILKK